MVVAVLSIHGVVSQSFKNNNSFGYNILVGARGGGLQLTLNTVYYLSSPVENIPYEPWERLSDVADWIELALMDGRLPADASGFESWATRTRPETETFICGPEAWGEGRTVAAPSPS